MAIRAQAGLATAGSEPGAATDALRVIEAEASRTLAEMRAMVRVLRRSDAAERAPTPGFDELRGLARSDAAGPTVDVRVDGDVGSLPPPVSAAVFRLAQEAVTNARRHARNATRVDVHVRVDGTGVRLDVRNDGVPVASAVPGYGLTGMAERADLLGGTCEAGPLPGGGWAVTAVLPRAGWAT